jgi:hypothetical protein
MVQIPYYDEMAENSCCCICGSHTWETIYRKKTLHPLWWLPGNALDVNLHYVMCQWCGYITLYPRLAPEVYETYYRLAPVPSREMFLARKPVLELRKAFIVDNIPEQEGNVVIEVGPAYGDFLLLLTGFRRRIGIEPSSKYYEHVTAENLPLEYYPYMLEQISEYLPELLFSANLTVASHVLEHAFNPRSFVKHLVQLIKPGAFVYIEVPSIEAMAEVENPVFQTLHFGHISQFSKEVLNQLCVSESLEPISVESSSKDNYPVIRGLYRRSDRAQNVGRLFQLHADYINAQARTAKNILGQCFTKGFHHIIVWGCGEDLLDVLNILDESELAFASTLVKFVDTNRRKQGRKLFGIEIHDPTRLRSDQIDAVLITSRSKLIQSDIKKNAHHIFHDAQIISLYP